MKRRNFLVGAGAAAIGGSALLGSGAFSEVNAQRSVTVQVAEDPNAYLGMDDCQDSDGNTTPNSSFASIDDNGHLQVQMTPDNPTNEGGAGDGAQGEGVNSESITWFDNVFQICNQGKEDVCLWISEKRGADPGRVTFYVDDDSRSNTATPERFVDDPLDTRERVMNDDGIQTFNSVGNSIPIDLGDCVCVGMEVYTREDDDFNIEKPSEGDQLLDGVTITADVNEQSCRTTFCGVTGVFNCVNEAATDREVGSHAFDLTNVGDVTVPAGSGDIKYVLLDSPDQDQSANLQSDLDPGDTRLEDGESAFPVAGVLAYVPDDECDEILGQQRDNWDGIDSSELLTLPEDPDGTVRYDLIEGLTESRYTEIQNIGSYSDLENAFDDGTADPDPEIPPDAYITHIDYSGYDLDAVQTDDIAQDDTIEFEQRIIDSSDIPVCS